MRRQFNWQNNTLQKYSSLIVAKSACQSLLFQGIRHIVKQELSDVKGIQCNQDTINNLARGEWR